MELSYIKEIDEQHTKLFALLDQIKRWAGTEFESDVVFTGITGLLDYAEQHFKFEESLLKKYNHGTYDYQIAAHSVIQTMVSEILNGVLTGDSSSKATLKKLLSVIEDWLITHIDEEAVDFRQNLLPTIQEDS